MPGAPSEAIARGREALRAGDALGARSAFEAALSGPTTGAALEGMSAASYVLMEFPRAIDEMERAYAAHRAAGDGPGAVRTARTLGYLHGSTTGDWAVAGGWIARAKTLLVDQPDSSEHGWVALTQGMFEDVRTVKEERYTRAVDIGRRSGDAELVFCTLAYLGASLVHDDRVEEGMVLLDEALAAVAGGEVDDFIVLEEIFCQMFSACERAQDVTRAEQWIRVGEAVAERRGLPAVSAYCRTHYGGILTAAGRWPEADDALTEAVRLWALGRRTLKAGALARLADLRVKQGRLEEAEQLLVGMSDDPEATVPLASLQLARGLTALAQETLERALARTDPRDSSVLRLLALLTDIHLAGDDLEAADITVEALAECSLAHHGPYPTAAVCLARGRIALAKGNEDPRRWLRQALDAFTSARLPLEAALCRLDLARAFGQASPEVAVTEARMALAEFERLTAARHADEALALLRRLGARVSPARSGEGGALSRREGEVLSLLGEGLSNPQIAQRLFISRKTVEHHVGNILLKLGLRNRAEAAAYAVRAGTGNRDADRATK
jgi:DNA-binding CsgD family transcriptional regulator